MPDGTLALASLAWGVLAERVPARWLLAGAEIAAAAGVVALPTASTALQGTQLAVALGAAARATACVRGASKEPLFQNWRTGGTRACSEKQFGQFAS